MKVLFLSVTAGQGHNSCAKSAMSALAERGVDCEMLDTIKYINEMTGNVVDKGYVTMGKHIPKVWGTVYNTALKTSLKGSIAKMRPYISHKLRDYIHAYKPDAIVCTHIFASQLITNIRKKNMIQDVPVIGINTDFSLHPFWEDVVQDYIVLACDKMHYGVIKRGIAREKILPFGIPVHKKFDIDITKQEARAQLGLEDKQTLLVMSGSMGFGNMAEDVLALDVLPLDFQMLVVCGSNEKLRSELTARIDNGAMQKKIHVFGFIDNVHLMMYASDVICTKPGGLSVSETLAVGRPLILLEPIPGLEDYNAWFLANCGVAVHTGKYYPLSEAVMNLMSDHDSMHIMLRAQKEISPRHAADKLADFLCGLMERRRNAYMPVVAGKRKPD